MSSKSKMEVDQELKTESSPKKKWPTQGEKTSYYDSAGSETSGRARKWNVPYKNQRKNIGGTGPETKI